MEYEIDEPDDIPDIKLPKIVLQPLVENAIYHGIKESERPGKITITVSKRDTFIDICIADNGGRNQRKYNEHQRTWWSWY